MVEAIDMKIIVHAFDEAQRLLRAHVELSADAVATIGQLDELFAEQEIVEAIERTRLRSLRESLISPADSATLT